MTSAERSLFDDGPEPERSAARAERAIAAAEALDAARLARLRRDHPEALARVLRALCASAPYLSATLVREPGLLFALAEDELTAARSPEAMGATLDAALAAAPASELGLVLRRFKYAELARITVRDASPELVPEERVQETLGELAARIASDFGACSPITMCRADTMANGTSARAPGAPSISNGSSTSPGT